MDRMLYVAMTESCTDYTYAPRSAAETAAGGSDMRFASRLPPGHDGQFGKLAGRFRAVFLFMLVIKVDQNVTVHPIRSQ